MSELLEGKNVSKNVRFSDHNEMLIHPEKNIVKSTTASKSEVRRSYYGISS